MIVTQESREKLHFLHQKGARLMTTMAANGWPLFFWLAWLEMPLSRVRRYFRIVKIIIRRSRSSYRQGAWKCRLWWAWPRCDANSRPLRRRRSTAPRRIRPQTVLIWSALNLQENQSSINRMLTNDTVLSRGVRLLFRPTRKSSPWGNFSDGGLNQSIKRRLWL